MLVHLNPQENTVMPFQHQDTGATYTVERIGNQFALKVEGDDCPLYVSGDADKVLDLLLDTCTGTRYTENYRGCNCRACKSRTW
jgi:hypothetical protein